MNTMIIRALGKRFICRLAVMTGIVLLTGCAPRLDSPHATERLEALKKVSDPSLLAKFACTDAAWEVRLYAAGHVTDQAVLTKVALEDADGEVGCAAVLHLTDQAALAKVALGAPPPEVRLAAVRRLTDQNALAGVAIRDKVESIRKIAIRKLTDQAALAQVALETDDPAIIRKLTDPAVLAKYILDRQARLTKTALESSFSDEALAAFGKLTNPDQAVLAKLALHALAPEVGLAAGAKLTDQAALSQVAQSGGTSDVRLVAINRLTDQTVLTQIALKSDADEERIAAIRKLTDQTVLVRILNEDKKEDETDEAETEIHLAAIGQITDQKVLADSAVSSFTPILARSAFLKVTDPAALKTIADNDGEMVCDFKPVAQLELQGQAALAQAVTQGLEGGGTLDSKQRRLAFRALTEPGLLAKLAEGTKESDLQLAAQMRVKKINLNTAIADAVAGTRNPTDVMSAAEWLEDPDSIGGTAEKLCEACIRKGDPANIRDLAGLLTLYGDKYLAEMYANSGQKDLEAAAKSWAADNGFTLTTEYSNAGYGPQFTKWKSAGH